MADWQKWQKTVDYVVTTQGRWYGLCDGDGNPLATLQPPVELDSADQWMQSTDIELTFPVLDDDGRPSRAYELLVGDGIRHVNESGMAGVAEGDFMIVVAFRGPGGSLVRRGGMVTHVTAQDSTNSGIPTSMTVFALSIMDVWNTVPAVSWPVSWWKARPYEVRTDESGLDYATPRRLAKIQFATKSVFAWKQGRAGFVVRRLAQESLDAVGFSQADPDGTQWVDDPYHVVEVPEVDNSPEISLEARDGMLWETVSAQARNSGLILGARLWWPGDDPVRSWSLARSGMQPRDLDISPSQGESQRRIVYNTFDHAMVVLEVKEVARS